MMLPKIRIGIVGCGGMAHYHAENFRKIRNVELTSCLDLAPERAKAYAAKHRVRYIAANLEELVDQVDAVSVVTPDPNHADSSLVVLRANKHLLCEKPLTVTLAEARQVAAAAEQAGRYGAIHMVNFYYRRSAALQTAMRIAAADKLGALRHVHSFYLQSTLSCEAWGHWTAPAMLWRLQTAAGSRGALGDIGCHILDLTTAVAGEVARLRCDLRTFPKIDKNGKSCTAWKGRKLDANDSALVGLEFTNGAVGVVQISRWATGHLNHLRFEAHGTKGALRFDLARDDGDYRRLDLCLGKTAKNKVAWTTRTLAETPSIWQRFIHAVRTGCPDQPDILRGAQVQAYLDACERSARSGRWEKPGPWIQ